MRPKPLCSIHETAVQRGSRHVLDVVRFGTRRKPRAGADIPAGKHDHGTEEIERHRKFRVKFLTSRSKNDISWIIVTFGVPRAEDVDEKIIRDCEECYILVSPTRHVISTDPQVQTLCIYLKHPTSSTSARSRTSQHWRL